MFRKALSFVVLVTVLAGCNAAPVQQNSSNQGGSAGVASEVIAPVVSAANPETGQQQAKNRIPEVQATAVEKTVPAKRPTNTPTTPAVPTKAAPQPLGPEAFPDGVNPLTGLRVEDPEKLDLAPALVSVTNFPVTARPQAGLSFSPYVYEMYVGEGMTRFLAVFYGDYPQKGSNSQMTLSDDRIGPVRSGRLPYEALRKLYNGFLVMTGASSVVLPSLGQHTSILNEDDGDVNSALISATKLVEIASNNPKRLEKDALNGLRFDAEAPVDGKAGKMIWIPFNFLNQVIWRYDASSGSYLRYQDNADGTTFTQMTDRLNSKPLTYENVVVLFAYHEAKRETLVNITLEYVKKMPALVFRDGKMYEVFWTTANGEYEKRTGLVRPIRFIDAEGKPFPMKPGQTWVEIVQQYTRYNETVDSESYFDLKRKTSPGSGNWAIHFFPTIPERQ